MVQTMLEGAAAAVHRQGHRNSFLDAEADPTRRSISLLGRIEQVPQAQVEQQTVATPRTKLIDRAVNVPLVTQRQMPTIEEIPKIVEIPQAHFMTLRYTSSACDSDVQKTVELTQDPEQ